MRSRTLARLLRESEAIESVYAMADSASSDNLDRKSDLFSRNSKPNHLTGSPAASDATATSRGYTNRTGASHKSNIWHNFD